LCRERVVPMPHRLLKKVLDQIEHVDRATIEEVIWLAIEIAREGREGRKVGTLFVISDSDSVLKHSVDTRPSFRPS